MASDPEQKRSGKNVQRADLAAENFLTAAREQGLGIVDALHISVESFQFLSGKTPREVEQLIQNRDALPPVESKALGLLEAISMLTQEDMRAMNEAHPGLPPDSLAKTLDLVTRPGASVVVLVGQPNATFGERNEVLGYGIVIRGKENFPEWHAEEPEHRIPEHLFEGSDIHHRLIRLFVRDSARDQESAGRAFDLIINKIKDICAGEPIIAMVLTDMFCVSEVEQDRSYDKGVWLAAKGALERRGFEDAHCGFTETIACDNQPVVSIPFRWYTFPARTEAGRQQYELAQRSYDELEAYRQAQLAGVVSKLPLSGGTVLYVGSQQSALSLAAVCGNLVVNEAIASSDPRENRHGRRMNLVTLPASKNVSLPHGRADAVVMNGILPDIALGSGDPRQAIENFVSTKLDALHVGGALIIRDTVAPPDRGPLYIYLSNDESFAWSSNKTPAELFEEFVATRSEPSIDLVYWNQVRRMEDAGSLACFYAPAHIAAEFLLKYRYYKYPHERFREYTLQTLADRLELGSKFGLRLVHAAPEFNRFVLEQHRMAGVSLQHEFGPIHDPFPTNHLTVFQKVGSQEGIRIEPGRMLQMEQPPFVTVKRYEQVDESGHVVGYQEIAARRGTTIDIIPYRIDQGRLYVWGREFPRPITTVYPHLDGSIYGGYLTEQLAGVVDASSLSTVEARHVETRAVFSRVTGTGFPQDAVIEQPTEYFVKPDTVDEIVVSTAVELDDLPLYNTVVTDPGLVFGGSYSLRAFDALRVLQSAQVGHSLDARLERKVYQLLLEKQLSCGAWLGERTQLRTQRTTDVKVLEVSDLVNQPHNAPFRVARDQSLHFLEAHRQEFIEHTAGDIESRRTRPLEYVEPDRRTGFSHQSLSLLPIAKVLDSDGREEILVGLEVRDLPSVQDRTGSSRFLTIPTARIPRAVRTLDEAYKHGIASLQRVHGVRARHASSLGGKYVVSPGVTPEIIYPLLVEVNLENTPPNSLNWVRLRDLIPVLPHVRCAQLITSIYRAAHRCRMLE